MLFLVMPKDIQVKERFAAKWAHQPHTQMHSPNVSANGSS